MWSGDTSDEVSRRWLPSLPDESRLAAHPLRGDFPHARLGCRTNDCRAQPDLIVDDSVAAAAATVEAQTGLDVLINASPVIVNVASGLGSEAVIRDTDSPTGTFTDRHGVVPW
jgi:hypothetical protein